MTHLVAALIGASLLRPAETYRDSRVESFADANNGHKKFSSREGFGPDTTMNEAMRTLRAVGSLNLTSIFEAEVTAIFGFFVVRCGSRSVAEDLTAETFTDASRQFAKGRGHEVTPAWLRTVARRRLIDHWRSLGSYQRRVDALTRERHDTAPDSDPDGRIDEALNSLSERQRAVLVLRYLDDFSTSEVAEVIGVSYKATESLLARARASFAQAYEGTQT